MGWFWWLRNFRREGATWADQALRLGAALDTRSRDSSSTPRLDGVDHVEAYLADPEAERDHPSHRPRMRLRVLDLFLRAELGQVPLKDERTQEYARGVRASMARGGPDSARFPGIIWPLMAFVLGNTEGIRDDMERSLANCREHGGDWEIGAALLFGVHVAVDSPGGMDGVDETLAELRTVARRTGDRWMLAQVSSAGGETAMARSRFDEARSEFEDAMRLAVEVGAYVETPFLIARLGEIAYYVGDRAQALAALDEATAAADRYAVPDSRAFVLLMRSQMAFDDRDFVQARELHGAARVEMERGTPPAQFLAALNGLDALLTAVETSPGHGLRKLVDTLREAATAPVLGGGPRHAGRAGGGRPQRHRRPRARGPPPRRGLPLAPGPPPVRCPTAGSSTASRPPPCPTWADGRTTPSGAPGRPSPRRTSYGNSPKCQPRSRPQPRAAAAAVTDTGTVNPPSPPTPPSRRANAARRPGGSFSCRSDPHARAPRPDNLGEGDMSVFRGLTRRCAILMIVSVAAGCGGGGGDGGVDNPRRRHPPSKIFIGDSGIGRRSARRPLRIRRPAQWS